MESIVKYKNREIDLDPYFNGFPYFGFMLSDENNTLYYYHRGETIQFFETSLEKNPDLEHGHKISELDFSKFTAWKMRYHAPHNAMYFTGDEKNDEKLNIYKMHLDTGNKESLTNEDYIYGWNYIDDKSKIAFIARKNGSDRMVSSLKILDLNDGTIETILEDTPEWTFTWTTIKKQPGKEVFIWEVAREFDRNRHNIIVFNRETQETKIVLDPETKRSMFGILEYWLDDHTFAYTSDENGFLNLYTFDLNTMTSRQITRYEKPLSHASIIDVDGINLLAAVQQDPINDKLIILEPNSGAVMYENVFGGKLNFFRTETNRHFLFKSSATHPFNILEADIVFVQGQIEIKTDDFLTYPKDLLNKIVHGQAEPIHYPTFDIDKKTNSTRKIHAFLLIPDNLPEDPSQRRAIITAFYGGDNHYFMPYHIFLQAGFIVMSPAVRGSWGFGADFYSLNDRDLGGNEIIDLIYAGKYLTERFGLKEEQIGLEGGSHGGYCAMRALTFPEEVNGNQESFNWGFAISEFGISNIIDYYHTCNIPDWVLQKAGNPETEKEKLLDRSPISHADKATGPLLLVHGENDNRVPVEQSKQMADAMEKAGKPYKFIEIPGQGHGWRGLTENVRHFTVIFEFLSEI